jgi:hypothetical protein
MEISRPAVSMMSAEQESCSCCVIRSAVLFSSFGTRVRSGLFHQLATPRNDVGEDSSPPGPKLITRRQTSSSMRKRIF